MPKQEPVDIRRDAGKCGNCGADLQGPYCHRCGQDAEVRVDSLRGFLAETMRDIAHLDSRLVRSLRHLLFRPGVPTVAYFRGARRSYLQPVQLYLLTAALFFLANEVRPFLVVNGEEYTVESSLGVMAASQSYDGDEIEALRGRSIGPELFEERFRTIAGNQLPVLLVGVVIAFALALALFHPLAQRNLLVHVVLSLHFTAFYLLLMIAERVGSRPGEPSVLQALGLLGLVWLGVALRRVYGQSLWIAWPKAIALFLVFNLCLAMWVIAVMAVAVQRV